MLGKYQTLLQVVEQIIMKHKNFTKFISWQPYKVFSLQSHYCIRLLPQASRKHLSCSSHVIKCHCKTSKGNLCHSILSLTLVKWNEETMFAGWQKGARDEAKKSMMKNEKWGMKHSSNAIDPCQLKFSSKLTDNCLGKTRLLCRNNFFRRAVVSTLRKCFSNENAVETDENP